MVLNWLDVGFAVACIHALGAIAAIHAVLTVRTSQGAVAWAVSLVTMPYLTLIPYLFLGRSKPGAPGIKRCKPASAKHNGAVSRLSRWKPIPSLRRSPP